MVWTVNSLKTNGLIKDEITMNHEFLHSTIESIVSIICVVGIIVAFGIGVWVLVSSGKKGK